MLSQVCFVAENSCTSQPAINIRLQFNVCSQVEIDICKTKPPKQQTIPLAVNWQNLSDCNSAYFSSSTQK